MRGAVTRETLFPPFSPYAYRPGADGDESFSCLHSLKSPARGAKRFGSHSSWARARPVASANAHAHRASDQRREGLRMVRERALRTDVGVTEGETNNAAKTKVKFVRTRRRPRAARRTPAPNGSRENVFATVCTVTASAALCVARENRRESVLPFTLLFFFFFSTLSRPLSVPSVTACACRRVLHLRGSRCSAGCADVD